jgi:magnesium-transporting ATPase (P-type)
MTTVYRPYKGCDTVRVVVKGAPEYIMPYCNSQLDSQGNIVSLNEDQKERILNKEIIDNFAKNHGYRTFLYAYKDMNSEAWENLQAANNNFVDEESRYIIEEELTFVAGFGIEDLLRQGVNVSVMNLREARICVRMVSGDNIETAKQAALKAGIITQSNLSDDDVCMTGEDLMAILGN